MTDQESCLTGNVTRVLATVLAPVSLAAGLSLGAPAAQADTYHSSNTYIHDRLCVGFACVDGEAYSGYDGTLRLKETVPRIDFVDTSSASFPQNNWRIQANQGGGPLGTKEFFAIEDVTAGYIPFAVEAGAGANALYIDAGGKVGFGTETPVKQIHVVDGDSPALRLEQDTSSGFTPQTWDIAGNETNFFIADRTAGDTLPFRVVRAAPSNSVLITADGDVGLFPQRPSTGSRVADAALHIQRTDGTAGILVEDTGTANGNISMLQLTNRSGRARMQFTSVGSVGQTGDWSISSGLTFVLQERLAGKNVFVMSNNGDLKILGELTTAGSCAAGCDRVFDADYALPSIAEHTAAMWENGYLPNVGPTAEDAPFNVSDKMGRMLNELEHAHIFIGQQQTQIEMQDSRIAALEAKLETLLAR